MSFDGTLSHEAFLECINNDFPQIKMTMNDLVKPSRPFVMTYYTTMLSAITGLPVMSFHKLNDYQIENLQRCPDGPSLKPHIECRNLYYSVKYILDQVETNPCDVSLEFRFSDMLLPSLAPNRSFIFMYKIYVIFTECADFDGRYPVVEIIEEKQKEVAQINQDKAAIMDEIKREEQNILRNRARKEDVSRQLNALIMDNSEKQKYIKSLECEEVELQTQLLALQSQEKATQEEFNKLDNERKYQESLIVSDDQQVMSEHMKLVAKREECSRKIQECKQKMAEGSVKLTQCNGRLSLYDALIETLGSEVSVDGTLMDLPNLRSKAQALKKDIQARRKEEEAMQKQLREKSEEALPGLEEELKNLEKEEHSISKSLSSQESQNNAVIAELQRNLSDTLALIGITEESVKDFPRQIQEKEATIAQKANEIRELDEKCGADWKAFESAVCSIIENISLSHYGTQKS